MVCKYIVVCLNRLSPPPPQQVVRGGPCGGSASTGSARLRQVPGAASLGGWPWQAKQGRWGLRQPNAARNGALMSMALLGSAWFCPEGHTTYGVGEGLLRG